MSEGKMCTIRLVRPFLWADLIRSYRILLNGEFAGKIGNHGVLELAAPAGTNTIEARIDWARSQPLTINAVPGQTIELEVRNNWGAARALWAVTFGKDSYLSLTQRPAGSSEKAP
jgi:hypothetical protein